MIVPNFTALYDACVLYPYSLSDLLMRLAESDLFRARWTDDIHDEWTQSVHQDLGISMEKLERRRAAMDESVLDCKISGYQALIEGLHSQIRTIVTFSRRRSAATCP